MTGARGPAQVRAVVEVVGRASELAVLDEACQAIAEGSGAIISITGESGIGKSRLVVEARRRHGDRIRFLEGRAGSYAESFPYWPVRDLLRDWLSIGVDAPEARLRLELKAALGGLGEGTEPAYPFLARLLGLPLEAEAQAELRELSREAVQQQTFAAVGTVVRRLAEANPLCVVFDDLQWADSLTLELVEHLLGADRGGAARARSSSTAPIATSRRGAWASTRAPSSRTAIARSSCGRCRPAASRELAEALAEATLPGSLADLLAERAGGNPFFLEEALQDLIERGALKRRDGGWELADGQIAVPTLVQGALQARLDRLPARTREVVSVASAVGRGFGLPLLEKLLSHEQVVPALSDLMRLDLIVEVSRRPSPEYRFRHGLVQEVAYNSLLEPARRNLHRRIGEAIEALYGDAGESVYGPLARHFSEADEPERAARYSLARRRRRALGLRRPRGARPLPPRPRVPAPARRSRARARDALQDRARAPPGVRLRARRPGLRRGVRLLRRGAQERAPTPARLEIALVRPDSVRARRHVLERFRDRDRAAVPRAPAHRPRPQRRARAGAEHERLGRRPDVPVHAARGRAAGATGTR